MCQENENPGKFVLYADDDADDRMLLVETFDQIAPGFTIKTVEDGYATMNFLTTRTPPLPCLLILDLNMPGMSGKEVMRRVKNNSQYDAMNIVAFTTSASLRDREECASMGVDMITKPLDLQEFELTASKLMSYCK